MMVSQGGFGGSTSGVGVRKVYEAIFGEAGRKPIFPGGVPATIPEIDITKKLREENLAARENSLRGEVK
jgi:penicillin-binding protein 2